MLLDVKDLMWGPLEEGPMSRHVLLVEDELNIIEAIRFLLTREGFEHHRSYSLFAHA